MMERKWEREVIPLCGELRIGFVAYSPVAGGFCAESTAATPCTKATTCAG